MSAEVMWSLLVQVQTLAADPIPDEDDVVAGGWGALMFVLLIVACVILFVSLRNQLRKTDRAKDAGVFGDPPKVESEANEPTSEAR